MFSHGAVEDLLDLVKRRSDFVEALSDGPRQMRDLVHDLEYSRSTVHRAIRELEDVGWVEKSAAGYRTTRTGEAVGEYYRTFRSSVDAAQRSHRLLDALDDEFAIPPTVVPELTVTEDGTDGPADRLPEDAIAVRAYLPDAAPPALVRELVTADCDVDATVGAAAVVGLERFATGDAETVRQASSWTVSADASDPLCLLLVETETGRRVVGSLVDDADAPLHFQSADRSAVEWARGILDGAASPDGQTRGSGTRLEPRPTAVAGDGDEAVVGDPLPPDVASGGFERVGPADDDVDGPPSTTGLRHGFTMEEIQAGLGFTRTVGRDGERVPVDRDVVERLQTDRRVAVLGPAGSGKSTLCKHVASRWLREGRGPVLHRPGNTEVPFEAVDSLVEWLREAPETPLVFVEDAIRGDANAVFEVMYEVDDDAVFLLDSRAGEWDQAADFPIDARLETFRQEDVTTRSVPEFDDAELERLASYAGRFEGGLGRLDATTLTTSLDRGTGQFDVVEPGRTMLLFHHLAAVVDPQGTLDDESTTLLDEVRRRYDHLKRESTDLAFDVALLLNALNAAGLTPRSAYAYALVDGVDDHRSVDRALEAVEPWLFGATGSESQRPVHETWSTLFLEHFLDAEGGDVAHRQFGRVLSTFLSMADDRERRDRVYRESQGRVEELARVRATPGEWAVSVVERTFGLGRRYAGLARLYGRSGYSWLTLPEACPETLRYEVTKWRASAYLDDARYEDAADELDVLGDRLRDADSLDQDWRDDVEAWRRLHLGKLHSRQGSLDAAEENYEAALEAYRRLGDETNATRTVNNLGAVYWRRGDRATAKGYFEQALDGYHAVGDRRGEAIALNNLGLCAWGEGNLAEAHEAYEESHAIRSAIGDTRGLADTETNLGVVARDQGDFAGATEHGLRSLHLWRDIGDDHGEANSLYLLGTIAYHRGDFDDAASYLEESRDLRETIGDERGLGDTRRLLARLALETGRPDDATTHLDAALECFHSVGDELEAANARLLSARLALSRDDPAAAADAVDSARESHASLENDRGIADSHLVRSLVHLARGRIDDAETDVRQATTAFETLESPHRVAETHLVHGRIDDARGDTDEARTHYDRALEHGRETSRRVAIRAIDRLLDLVPEDEAAEYRRVGRDLATEIGWNEKATEYETE